MRQHGEQEDRHPAGERHSFGDRGWSIVVVPAADNCCCLRDPLHCSNRDYPRNENFDINQHHG